MKKCSILLTYRFWLLTVGLELLRQVAGICDKTEVGVDLDDCPLPSVDHRIEASSEENPLRLEYLTYAWKFPALHSITHEIVENSFVTLVIKTYKVNDIEPMIPAPTLIWEKGATVYMQLTNSLYKNPDPDEETYVLPEEDWDEHWYAINIHTHGLHISSFEDDPSIHVYVGESRSYTFNVPENHAGGLHWYHPHIEAIGEYVTAGGTLGALVIEDDPHGTELPFDILEIEPKVLVIQKIFPGKLNDLHDGYIGPTDFINGIYPRMDLDDPTFEMFYDVSLEAILQLQRLNTFYTFVNGFIRPQTTVISGRWHRFRLLYVAGDDPVEMMSDGMLHIGLKPNSEGVVAETSCETIVIGKDGVYLPKSRRLNFEKGDRMWLHSASRAEILLKCDFLEPQHNANTQNRENLDQWLVMDVPFQRNNGEAKDSVGILNFRVVSNRTTETKNMQSAVLQRTDDFVINSCLPSYLPDMTLRDVQISAIAPFSNDIRNVQEIRASIRENTFGDYYDEETATLDLEVLPFDFNGEPFKGFGKTDVKNISVFELQKVYQMRLIHGAHPLHIHINHMQLQQDIEDESNYHKKGDFLDTISSACPNINGACVESEPRRNIERTVFRMFVDRFHGLMLMHCHNLDHADSGASAASYILQDSDEVVAELERAAKWKNGCSSQMHIRSESFEPDVLILPFSVDEIDPTRDIRINAFGNSDDDLLVWRIDGSLVQDVSGSTLKIDSNFLQSNSYIRVDVMSFDDPVAYDTIFLKTLSTQDLSEVVSVSSLPVSTNAYTDSVSLSIEGSTDDLDKIKKVCYYMRSSRTTEVPLVCTNGSDNFNLPMPFTLVDSTILDVVEVFARLYADDHVYIGTAISASGSLSLPKLTTSEFEGRWNSIINDQNPLVGALAAASVVSSLNNTEADIQAYRILSSLGDLVVRKMGSSDSWLTQVEVILVFLGTAFETNSSVALECLGVISDLSALALQEIRAGNRAAFEKSSVVLPSYNPSIISNLVDRAYDALFSIEANISRTVIEPYKALDDALSHLTQLGSYLNSDWEVVISRGEYQTLSGRIGQTSADESFLLTKHVRMNSFSSLNGGDLVFGIHAKPLTDPTVDFLAILFDDSGNYTIHVKSPVITVDLQQYNENDMQSVLEGLDIQQIESFSIDVMFDLDWDLLNKTFVFCVILNKDFTLQQTFNAEIEDDEIKCSFDAQNNNLIYIVDALPKTLELPESDNNTDRSTDLATAVLLSISWLLVWAIVIGIGHEVDYSRKSSLEARIVPLFRSKQRKDILSSQEPILCHDLCKSHGLARLIAFDPEISTCFKLFQICLYCGAFLWPSIIFIKFLESKIIAACLISSVIFLVLMPCLHYATTQLLLRRRKNLDRYTLLFNWHYRLKPHKLKKDSRKVKELLKLYVELYEVEQSYKSMIEAEEGRVRFRRKKLPLRFYANHEAICKSYHSGSRKIQQQLDEIDGPKENIKFMTVLVSRMVILFLVPIGIFVAAAVNCVQDTLILSGYAFLLYFVLLEPIGLVLLNKMGFKPFDYRQKQTPKGKEQSDVHQLGTLPNGLSQMPHYPTNSTSAYSSVESLDKFSVPTSASQRSNLVDYLERRQNQTNPLSFEELGV